MGSSHIAKYVLLWCIGFYLRLGPLIVPPLIPLLEREMDFSESQAALSTSLPMLLIGLGALIGGWLVARLGIKRTLLLGLVLMGLSSSLRSLPAGFTFFMLMTVAMGIGIALIQTGLPALTRAWLPLNLGRAAAIYTTGLLAGEWFAAGFTGTLVRHVLGEQWLLAFTVWMLPVPILIAVLLLRRELRQLPEPKAREKAPALPDWRDPLMWRIAAVMASSGTLYFSGNIFLPAILAETQRLHLLDISLSALNGFQLLSCIFLIAYADCLIGRKVPFYLLNLIALLMIPALVWAPGSSVVLAAGAAGMVTSTILVLALSLPAWAVPEQQVSSTSAGMLAVGYTLVFIVPVIGGWLADLSGERILAFLPACALAFVALASIGGLKRRESPHTPSGLHQGASF